jgi:hypothetical protein
MALGDKSIYVKSFFKKNIKNEAKIKESGGLS